MSQSSNSGDNLGQFDGSKNSLSGLLEKIDEDAIKQNLSSKSSDDNNYILQSISGEGTSPRLADELLATFDDVIKVPTHKTTTMANFYYKKSKSTENLDDLNSSQQSLASNE
jgi:hypothetical protein